MVVVVRVVGSWDGGGEGGEGAEVECKVIMTKGRGEVSNLTLMAWRQGVQEQVVYQPPTL